MNVLINEVTFDDLKTYESNRIKEWCNEYDCNYFEDHFDHSITIFGITLNMLNDLIKTIKS